ncbi:MAG: asparagine synthase C-terminal domain-containing protein, partial [Thermoplasmata archaeon]
PWEPISFGAEEVSGGARRAAGSPSPVHRQGSAPAPVQLALDLAFERLHGRTVVLGQGADELFGGYARFDGIGPEPARELSARDLSRLLDRDWPETVERARGRSISLQAPYLDPGVRSAVASVPAEELFGGTERKGFLRRIARAQGLPESMAGAPKKALQYGSGVSRELRRRKGPRSEGP